MGGLAGGGVRGAKAQGIGGGDGDGEGNWTGVHCGAGGRRRAQPPSGNCTSCGPVGTMGAAGGVAMSARRGEGGRDCRWGNRAKNGCGRRLPTAHAGAGGPASRGGERRTDRHERADRGPIPEEESRAREGAKQRGALGPACPGPPAGSAQGGEGRGEAILRQGGQQEGRAGAGGGEPYAGGAKGALSGASRLTLAAG